MAIAGTEDARPGTGSSLASMSLGRTGLHDPEKTSGCGECGKGEKFVNLVAGPNSQQHFTTSCCMRACVLYVFFSLKKVYKSAKLAARNLLDLLQSNHWCDFHLSTCDMWMYLHTKSLNTSVCR